MSGLPSQLRITRQFADGRPPDTITLRSVEELPEKFRPFFAAHPYFNILQSLVFEQVVFSDAGIVVSAPTGCGKTGVFELAMVRMLMKNSGGVTAAASGQRVTKAIYLAPVKALCDERFSDWSKRFGDIGYKVCRLTGDTDAEEYSEMKEADIVVATPEKWDSMTRRWKDNEHLVKMIRVFMVDEVHLIGDPSRGATLETVVSRMKTISAKLALSTGNYIRFVAVSATLANIEDFGEWLSTGPNKAVQFKLGDSVRPVQIEKFVYGYPFNTPCSEFKFDMTLNYKLGEIIGRHANLKPTLIFCSTRKSTIQAAGVLSKQANYNFTDEFRQRIQQTANSVRNSQLADFLRTGIGFHHAGLDRFDRAAVEELFLQGNLPVLVATSTLAMGVNLPAHLVIIKSTSAYVGGSYREYSETEIMQMIGRAGRPQFDTTAVAVIMTKSESRARFENITRGTQVTESSLHKQLIEHVNAEISLKTFSDSGSMLAWLKSTFLYLRIFRNPEYYELPKNITVQNTFRWLQELCSGKLRSLKEADLIEGKPEKFQSSLKGNLMARYYIAFSTMELFGKLTGQENLSELLDVFCQAKELAEVQLRVNEKMALNTLNRNKAGLAVIRFPMKGRITTAAMKVNCLIQATLGSLSITDHSLVADANKALRSASRVAKCLVAFVRTSVKGFAVNVSAIQLCKCIEARLWENTEQVARQIKGIGPTMASALVGAGYTSFSKLENANPREIEFVCNRRPPFGNQLLDAVASFPQYVMTVEQSANTSSNEAELTITVEIGNINRLRQNPTAGRNHAVYLLIGDAANLCLLNERLVDGELLRMDGRFTKKLTVKRAQGGEKLQVYLVSETMLGLDTAMEMSPVYTGMPVPSVAKSANTLPVPAKPKRNLVQSELNFPIKKRKSSSNTNPLAYSSEILDSSDGSEISLTSSHIESSDILPPPNPANRIRIQSSSLTGQSEIRGNILAPSTPPHRIVPADSAASTSAGSSASAYFFGKASGGAATSSRKPEKDNEVLDDRAITSSSQRNING